MSSTSLYYSVDNGITWCKLSVWDRLKVNAGATIQFKRQPHWLHRSMIGVPISSGRFNVEGNIMSLLYGDDFAGKTDLSDWLDAFQLAFNKSKVVDASGLVLPATTLSPFCYNAMFKGCSSLVVPPELPATRLAINCYQEMFKGCTSLVAAPALPATKLKPHCYQSMFKDCTSLTMPPELPAQTLEYDCYASMFSGCTGLTTAPVLPAATLANGCYAGMFKGCAWDEQIKRIMHELLPSASLIMENDSWVFGGKAFYPDYINM